MRGSAALVARTVSALGLLPRRLHGRELPLPARPLLWAPHSLETRLAAGGPLRPRPAWPREAGVVRPRRDSPAVSCERAGSRSQCWAACSVPSAGEASVLALGSGFELRVLLPPGALASPCHVQLRRAQPPEQSEFGCSGRRPVWLRGPHPDPEEGAGARASGFVVHGLVLCLADLPTYSRWEDVRRRDSGFWVKRVHCAHIPLHFSLLKPQ